MKQGTSFVLRVNFDYDLDPVSSIEFIFMQNANSVTFRYPDGNATRAVDDNGEPMNAVDLLWTVEDTYKIRAGEKMQMDTRIHLTDAATNPATPIISMKLGKTLFKEGVEA